MYQMIEVSVLSLLSLLMFAVMLAKRDVGNPLREMTMSTQNEPGPKCFNPFNVCSLERV